MSIQQLLQEERDDIRRIAANHGAFNVRVFGSVARGDAGEGSDVDLLVDAGPATSSWFPAGLMVDLEDILGRQVHIVTENALNPDVRTAVLSEALPL
ncbi:MAG: nucleotidyltransferase family protein [Planctomycetes bacterium]|nr:nucleotidyltransferase family protein [Planctomycetota bacterium]